MDAHFHARNESTNSVSPGFSYQLILEHILTYPNTYEIPLRKMYTINSGSRSRSPSVPPQAQRHGSVSSSANASPTSPTFPCHSDPEAQRLSNDLMAHIASLPNQPTSLPPSFIHSFLLKCFAADLRFVDFPQALAGLDYLKDLEMRRRKEVGVVLDRLGVTQETLENAEEDLARRWPAVLQWFKSLEEKERKIEALYTQLYVGLRRWILINELSLSPFNKHNCAAMLNTLYPPVISSQPTSKLTPTILKKQRDGFFKYIQGVEQNGPKILNNLIQQGKRATDENGWAAVRHTLDMYLNVSLRLIDECAQIIETVDASEFQSKRKGRKVDSGVSFGAPDKENCRPSSTGSDKSTASAEPAPAAPQGMRRKSSTPLLRGSTLERIARELKNMGRRHEVEEMIKPAPTASASEFGERPNNGGLRKIRSLSNLKNLRSANSSSTSLSAAPSRSETPVFDPEEMKRARLIYEANAAKTKAAGAGGASTPVS